MSKGLREILYELSVESYNSTILKKDIKNEGIVEYLGIQIDLAEADILKLVASEEEITTNISFKLDELYVKGLYENYPENFNKLMPKMGEAIRTLIIKKMKGEKE